MARKIKRIGRLPQLPVTITNYKKRRLTHDENERNKYDVSLSRALYDHNYALEQLIEENNNEGTATDAFAIVAVSGQSNVEADSPGDTLTLVAGTNITLTTNAGTDSVTIDATTAGAQNLFETIAVSGQSNIVADSATDTLTLAAGTGITLTTNATTDTVTIAAHAPQNLFETVAVSGQSDVVADSPTDTLTLAAGAGIAITTNAGTDTVTIAATSDNAGVTTGDTLWFGSGRDGSITFDGSTTFSFCEKTGSTYFTKRDIHGTNIVIDAGVTVAVYANDDSAFATGTGGGRIFATGKLTVNGHLHADGYCHDTSTNPNSAVHGVYVDSSSSYGPSGNGGAGGNSISNGSAGANSGNCWSQGNAGAGGTSSTGKTGGAGGTCTNPTASTSGGSNWLWTPIGMVTGLFLSSGSPFIGHFNGGPGGGGGGGAAGVGSGGAGGAGGGVMGVFCREIDGSGIISCDGGKGVDSASIGTGVGPGGGGTGGTLLVLTSSLNYASTVTRRADKGLGGTGNGGATNGSDGSDGIIAELFVVTLT